MNKKLILGGSVSLLCLGFFYVFSTNMAEGIISDLISGGDLPKKYLSSEGWVFNYSPLEHFAIASVAFTLLFYGTCVYLIKKRLDRTNILRMWIALYVASFIVITAEFWQLAVVHLIPMVGIAATAYIVMKDVMKNGLEEAYKTQQC